MTGDRRKIALRTRFLKNLTEVAFIMFLFYANLLMGEYTGHTDARNKGLLWALQDIITVENFIIGLIAALIGHIVVQFLRGRL